MKKKPVLEYYTDGACSGNPGPGGFGVVRISRCYRETYSEYIESLSLEYSYSETDPQTTNNRMELKAILKVLSMAETDKYHYIIYSDSAYAVNICNDWMYKWQANGWRRPRNKPVENLHLVQNIYDLLAPRRKDIEVRKCDGHAGIIENELADALATGNQAKFQKILSQNNILS